MIKYETFSSIEEIKSAFNINSQIHLLEMMNKIIVSAYGKDNVNIQIGWISKDGFLVNPDIALIADDLYAKFKEHIDSDQEEKINRIILELLDEADDESDWYCLSFDWENEALDHILFETQDFSKLVSGINDTLQV